MTEPEVGDIPFDVELLTGAVDAIDTRDDYGPPQPGCHMGWCGCCFADPYFPSSEDCTCGSRCSEPDANHSRPTYRVLRPTRSRTS